MIQMPGRLRTQNNILGTSLVDAEGKVEKVLMHCPHCGMIDYRFSAQGIKETLWPSCKVGSITHYECGKCRKRFYSLEVQVPIDMTPQELYEKLNAAIRSDPVG